MYVYIYMYVCNCMYVCLSVCNGFMTKVYKSMFSLCILRHMPFLVHLSLRYDGRLRGETTMMQTCERDRQRTAWCSTHILKVLKIILTALGHFIQSFHVLCVRYMIRMHIPSFMNDFVLLLRVSSHNEIVGA